MGVSSHCASGQRHCQELTRFKNAFGVMHLTLNGDNLAQGHDGRKHLASKVQWLDRSNLSIDLKFESQNHFCPPATRLVMVRSHNDGLANAGQ